MEDQLTTLAHSVFASICHQDPTILMELDGKHVPLCPRCIGLQLGFTFTFLALFSLANHRVSHLNPRALLILSAALACLGIDWGLGGQLGLYEPTVASRLLTGLGAGSALAVLFSVYRKSFLGNAGPQKHPLVKRSALLILSALILGAMIVSLGSWTVLTTLALTCLAFNALIALHTLSRLMMRSFSRERKGAVA